MVVDTALWIILAVATAFVAFGCRMTKPTPKPAAAHFQDSMNRAA